MSDRPTRDCQCPRANHQHGTRTAYVVDRCRCDPCREAARIYEAQRRRTHLYGATTTSSTRNPPASTCAPSAPTACPTSSSKP